jgi:hypothetical protein
LINTEIETSEDHEELKVYFNKNTLSITAPQGWRINGILVGERYVIKSLIIVAEDDAFKTRIFAGTQHEVTEYEIISENLWDKDGRKEIVYDVKSIKFALRIDLTKRYDPAWLHKPQEGTPEKFEFIA